MEKDEVILNECFVEYFQNLEFGLDIQQDSLSPTESSLFGRGLNMSSQSPHGYVQVTENSVRVFTQAILRLLLGPRLRAISFGSAAISPSTRLFLSKVAGNHDAAATVSDLFPLFSLLSTSLLHDKLLLEKNFQDCLKVGPQFQPADIPTLTFSTMPISQPIRSALFHNFLAILNAQYIFSTQNHVDLTESMGHYPFFTILDIFSRDLFPGHLAEYQLSKHHLANFAPFQTSLFGTGNGGNSTEARHNEQEAIFCGVFPTLRIQESYGTTETSMVTRNQVANESVVLKLRDVVDPVTNQLLFSCEDKPNPRGEILIHSASRAAGYIPSSISHSCASHEANTMKETKDTSSFLPDGWYATGDLGEQLPDGTIRVLARLSGSFKLANGEFVNPHLLESHLTKNQGSICSWSSQREFISTALTFLDTTHETTLTNDIVQTIGYFIEMMSPEIESCVLTGHGTRNFTSAVLTLQHPSQFRMYLSAVACLAKMAPTVIQQIAQIFADVTFFACGKFEKRSYPADVSCVSKLNENLLYRFENELMNISRMGIKMVSESSDAIQNEDANHSKGQKYGFYVPAISQINNLAQFTDFLLKMKMDQPFHDEFPMKTIDATSLGLMKLLHEEIIRRIQPSQ